MIVRTLEDLKGTSGDVRTAHWWSRRLLLREHAMGFTVTDTVLNAGIDQVMWYKNHLEACYCIEGDGTIEELSTGTTHEVRAGTLYALARHDRHRIRVRTRLRLI